MPGIAGLAQAQEGNAVAWLDPTVDGVEFLESLLWIGKSGYLLSPAMQSMSRIELTARLRPFWTIAASPGRILQVA